MLATAANRFAWQRSCCELVRGRILNAGCKEDPARLKATYGDRVTNVDRHDYDEDLWQHRGQRVPIPVDVIWDLLEYPWPFGADDFDLVVLAEILEDLPEGTQEGVLREAARVGRHVCITCPEDDPRRDPHHLTRITDELLMRWLAATGWTKVTLNAVPYGFVPWGYFVFAHREARP